MLYVLDLDDTLFLERDYVYSGFIAVDKWLNENQGVTGFFERIWELFEEGSRGHIFDIALKELGIEDSRLIEQLVWIYREHKPDIKLLQDAKEFIDKIPFQNLAIITDGYSNAQWIKIKALDLEAKIEQIIVTDDWGRDYWKPNPKAFITVQKSLSPEQCIYIADNPIRDFLAPKEVGWLPSIRIRRKGSLHFNIPTPEDYREVTSFYEIIQKI